MKRIVLALIVVAGLGLLLSQRPLRAQSQAPLPPCATDGDMDGDGVPDEIDSEERDSCLASHSGYEDCSDGDGDGLPDCQ